MKKIIALFLALTVVLSSCLVQKERSTELKETLPPVTEESSTTETTTQPETDTTVTETVTESKTESQTKSPAKKNPVNKTTTTTKAPEKKPVVLGKAVGSWETDIEYTMRELIDGYFYDDYGNLKVKVIYTFNKDGTYYSTGKILNYSEFQEEARMCIFEILKNEASNQGLELTDELMYELLDQADSEAAEIMKEFNNEISKKYYGKYTEEDLGKAGYKINCVENTGEKESFVLQNNQLILKESELPVGGIVFTKM